MEETFIQLPLQLDPQTKAISSVGKAVPKDLDQELINLNNLHRALLSPASPNAIPPPPMPVNPQRSANINKMREAANTAVKKNQSADAVKMYSLAIDTALGRPLWEPAGLVREELCILYANRAQAHMQLQNWPEASVDAECSVELKKVGNAKAWWRRAKALLEMQRLDEARNWIADALNFEGQDGELQALKKDIDAAIAKRDGTA